jgi:hypothetical protein
MVDDDNNATTAAVKTAVRAYTLNPQPSTLTLPRQDGGTRINPKP